MNQVAMQSAVRVEVEMEALPRYGSRCCLTNGWDYDPKRLVNSLKEFLHDIAVSHCPCALGMLTGGNPDSCVCTVNKTAQGAGTNRISAIGTA